MESFFSTNILLALLPIGVLLFGGYIFYELKKGEKKASDKTPKKGSELTELEKVKELQSIKQIKKPTSVEERQHIFEKAYQRKYPEAYKEYTKTETGFSNKPQEEQQTAENETNKPQQPENESAQVETGDSEQPKPIIVEVDIEPTNTGENPDIFGDDEEEEQEDQQTEQKNQGQDVDTGELDEEEYRKSEEYANKKVQAQAVNPFSIPKKSILGTKFSESEELHLANMVKMTKQIYNT